MRNPLFLLDEVDKMGQDFRGDPSSALLEVLDPEQNSTFVDHYVEVEYDLSDVMFVATANTMNIPAPLLDRMEVIRLSGYTEDEKIAIAKQYLLPKQMKNNGIKPGRAARVRVGAARHRALLHARGRRAQPRARHQQDLPQGGEGAAAQGIAKARRARAKGPVEVTSKNLDKYLGVRRFTYGIAEKKNQVGQVTGLAWTEVGGDLLTIEAVALPGKGKTTSTGKLGDVMNESIAAALSVVRHRSQQLGIPADFYQKTDLHIHLPEGATPKDGPSAGAAIVTAIVSILTGIPVRCDVAMTGEITLRGEVLPIGGLKEKLLAAGRGGIKTVLIPEENVKDLAEIPDEIKNRLEIHPVRWIEQVLEKALERLPTPLPDDKVVGRAGAARAVGRRQGGAPQALAANENAAARGHERCSRAAAAFPRRSPMARASAAASPAARASRSIIQATSITCARIFARHANASRRHSRTIRSHRVHCVLTLRSRGQYKDSPAFAFRRALRTMRESPSRQAVTPSRFALKAEKGKFVNKSELIDAIAKHADISKAAAGRALDATVDAIAGSLKKGTMVTLVGFGSFYVGKRAPRAGRNPRTGATDQDPRRQSAQVPRWKSAQGCAKLAVFPGRHALLRRSACGE